MRKFGWNKFWNCLTIFSLKWWRNPARLCFEIALQCFLLKRWGDSAERSIEIVLEYFRWSDEEIRLKQVLNLSENLFFEVIKKSGWDVFWNCLTMFSLKRWGKSAETSIEIVLYYFRWSDEEIRLKQVLKLPDNNFVETTRKFAWDEF